MELLAMLARYSFLRQTLVRLQQMAPDRAVNKSIRMHQAQLYFHRKVILKMLGEN